MSIKEIGILWQENRNSLLWGLVIIMSLVQITPIKINPWTWIIKTIGKHLNEDVIKKLDNQDAEINSLKDDVNLCVLIVKFLDYI